MPGELSLNARSLGTHPDRRPAAFQWPPVHSLRQCGPPMGRGQAQRPDHTTRNCGRTNAHQREPRRCVDAPGRSVRDAIRLPPCRKTGGFRRRIRPQNQMEATGGFAPGGISLHRVAPGQLRTARAVLSQLRLQSPRQAVRTPETPLCRVARTANLWRRLAPGR